MLEIFFLLVCTLVVPVLVNKSTEGKRFDFIKPWLRELWTMVFVFFSVYLLVKPEAREAAMRLHLAVPGWRGYVITALSGAICLSLYWYFTGIITPSERKLPGSGAENSAPAPSAPPPKPVDRIEAQAKEAPPLIHLIFKDSALLTPQRKKQIAHDMNGVARYLKSFEPLSIPIPDDIPPIGVDTSNPKGTGWALNSQANQKYYYNQFNLQPAMLDDRQKVTESFLAFAIGRFLYRPMPLVAAPEKMTSEEFIAATHTPEHMEWVYRLMAGDILRHYLNHSYWNQPFPMNQRPVCPDQGDGMSYYFWQMRESFGKDFADRLALSTMRALVDKPYTVVPAGASHPYRHYFYERLVAADSVIDNEKSKMKEIDSILERCGWLPLT
jgi:hypothetical protein